MEEDVLGTRQSVTGQVYERCARCGQPGTRDQLSALPLSAAPAGTIGLPAPAADEPPTLLCPDCAEEVARGEPLYLDRAGRSLT